jgi:hypothetical protein
MFLVRDSFVELKSSVKGTFMGRNARWECYEILPEGWEFQVILTEGGVKSLNIRKVPGWRDYYDKKILEFVETLEY